VDWKKVTNKLEGLGNKLTTGYGVYTVLRDLTAEPKDLTVEHLTQLKTDLETLLRLLNGDIMDQLNQLEVQGAFRDDERYIIDSLHQLKRVLEAEKAESRKQLLDQVDILKLVNSIKHILEGLSGQSGKFGTDLLQKIAETADVRSTFTSNQII
jgi:ERCC4-related helicase